MNRAICMDFIDFVTFLGVIPLLIYYLNYRIKAFEINYLLPFLWVFALGSLYEYFVTKLLQVDSQYWFWLNKLLYFFTISYFFKRLLSEKYKRLYFYSNFLFLLFFGFLLFNYENITKLEASSYFSVLQTIFIYLFSILWFIKIFKEAKVTSLLSYPIFYIVSGFLIYYSGVVVLYLLSDSILRHKEEQFLSYWMLIVYLNLFFRIILIISVWKSRSK